MQKMTFTIVRIWPSAMIVFIYFFILFVVETTGMSGCCKAETSRILM